MHADFELRPLWESYHHFQDFLVFLGLKIVLNNTGFTGEIAVLLLNKFESSQKPPLRHCAKLVIFSKENIINQTNAQLDFQVFIKTVFPKL